MHPSHYYRRSLDSIPSSTRSKGPRINACRVSAPLLASATLIAKSGHPQKRCSLLHVMEDAFISDAI
jgi:hypothetical protein